MSEFAQYTAKSKAPATNGDSDKQIGSAWGNERNPAAFDFRSDVHTTPTMSMLRAIQECSLLDDVSMEDPTTLGLEKFIAELTGKEDALLVLSGSMGNQVSLRSHLTAPPHAIVCDRRSHIIQYEAGGVASLSGALTQPIDAKNGTYITLEEVQKLAVISDDVHACPTRMISLENTLGGVITPLAECQRIAAWARENKIIMHLDGARLWEAVAAGAGTLKEFSACFDTISLCFSKGLGAPIGSILVGSNAFRARARHIRKMIGGGMRQAGVVTAPARVAVEDTFLGGKLKASHVRARQIADMWEGYGGKLTAPTETNMVWFDLEAAGTDAKKFIEDGERAGLRLMGGRLVVHYQIGDEAVRRLDVLMRAVLKGESLQGNGKVELGAEKLAIEAE